MLVIGDASPDKPLRISIEHEILQVLSNHIRGRLLKVLLLILLSILKMTAVCRLINLTQINLVGLRARRGTK